MMGKPGVNDGVSAPDDALARWHKYAQTLTNYDTYNTPGLCAPMRLWHLSEDRRSSSLLIPQHLGCGGALHEPNSAEVFPPFVFGVALK